MIEIPPTPTANKVTLGVRWSSIFASSGFFLAGVVFALFVFRMKSSSITFTALDLIGFSLSIGLAGASIVLALAAMSSGRASEDALTRRSDESIRLQNEVFLKTTDALTRIESSTGVTEKRIEDIIAGRVGAIAESLAETTMRGGKPKSEKQIQELIHDAIQQSVGTKAVASDEASRVRRAQSEARRKERAEIEAQYQAKHDSLLQDIAAYESVRAIKLGHGDPGATGFDMFDAVFVLPSGKRVFLSSFRSEIDADEVAPFLMGLPRELASEDIELMFLVMFGAAPEAKALMEGTLAGFKHEIEGKIVIVNSEDPGIAATAIQDRLGKVGR